MSENKHDKGDLIKGQAFNPYLPSWGYMPDGEPHVFDGRVYIYGSHDRFNGGGFCVNDYETWSAPADDLNDWRYEDVIYKKTYDPNYHGRDSMYAPDGKILAVLRLRTRGDAREPGDPLRGLGRPIAVCPLQPSCPLFYIRTEDVRP